jgi:hypothetical protein
MDVVLVAPLGSLIRACVHLEDDRFGRLAHGDDQEDLEMIGDAEGAAESVAVDGADHAAAEALDLVVADYRPNQLTSYLFELSNRYSAFYEACPVLKAETEPCATAACCSAT